jgi:hypothetical protein
LYLRIAVQDVKAPRWQGSSEEDEEEAMAILKSFENVPLADLNMTLPMKAVVTTEEKVLSLQMDFPPPNTGACPMIRNPENKTSRTLLGIFTLTSTMITVRYLTSTLFPFFFSRLLVSDRHPWLLFFLLRAGVFLSPFIFSRFICSLIPLVLWPRIGTQMQLGSIVVMVAAAMAYFYYHSHFSSLMSLHAAALMTSHTVNDPP